MSHQKVIDGWTELLAMIEAARTATEHPDAHSCMDALKALAEGHTEFMLQAKAEHDASHE